MTEDDLSARLNRFEKKLDEIGNSLVTLIRVEERQTAMTRRLDTIDARINSHGNRLVAMEKKDGASALRWLQITGVALLTALAAAAIDWFVA